MAITKHTCTCGAAVTQLTGLDKAKPFYHVYDFQVVTTDDFNNGEMGYTLYRCENCGEPIEETIPALNHPTGT